MLKQYPPFVASLHVTVRIEPLSREIDVDAAFEKLTSGLECGAQEAVRGTCWKGYSITIDKVPPAPSAETGKRPLDPNNVAPTPMIDELGVIKQAIAAELARQMRSRGSGFDLPNFEDELAGCTYTSKLTVSGILNADTLAEAIFAALKA